MGYMPGVMHLDTSHVAILTFLLKSGMDVFCLTKCGLFQRPSSSLGGIGLIGTNSYKALKSVASLLYVMVASKKWLDHFPKAIVNVGGSGTWPMPSSHIVNKQLICQQKAVIFSQNVNKELSIFFKM